MLVKGVYILDQVCQGEPHFVLLSIVEPGAGLPMKVNNQVEDKLKEP